MLKFIKQLFRRSNPAGPALQPSAKPPRSHPGHEVPRSGIAPVETAQISLAAILSKFNDELKASIARMPDPEATVALPVPTILKQLPTGSVKMSLASIRRQAPPGVFKAGKFEEKLMVDVPLGEIFRRVRPELLRRRDDQRAYVLPGEDFTLFNSKGGAAAAPAAQDGEAAGSSVAEPPPLPARAIAPPASSMAPRKVAPPSAVVASVARPNALKIGPKPGQPAAAKPAAKPSPLTPRSAPTPAPAAPAAPATPSPQMVAAAGQPPLVLALKDLSGAWPEPVNREIDAVPGVTVALPAADLTAGLARGKVAFTWGQLRSWMNPAPSGASIADEAAELVLPLRLIAPAFLKHSKREEPAKKAALPMDEEIPALFHGNTPAPKPAAPAPVETPAAEAPAAAAPEPVAAAAVEAEAPAPVPAAPAAPEVPAAPPAPAPKPVAQSVGEVFGQPEKANWSPVDIVQGLVKLPGIEGAIVALQEGLVVAHELPENLKGDVFAAFIPQIFARLNHYAGEMALGEVDDLLINLRGAHCQMYRRGQVYFAVLGKTGESLPSHELSLCAEALTK